ncbi:hypothetical protein A2U01_0024004, partial [Trifolium medium]|nr:hypothetical protein [Trifolium medium]
TVPIQEVALEGFKSKTLKEANSKDLKPSPPGQSMEYHTN